MVRPPDLPHATLAEQRSDLVRADAASGTNRHFVVNSTRVVAGTLLRAGTDRLPAGLTLLVTPTDNAAEGAFLTSGPVAPGARRDASLIR